MINIKNKNTGTVASITVDCPYTISEIFSLVGIKYAQRDFKVVIKSVPMKILTVTATASIDASKDDVDIFVDTGTMEYTLTQSTAEHNNDASEHDDNDDEPTNYADESDVPSLIRVKVIQGNDLPVTDMFTRTATVDEVLTALNLPKDKTLSANEDIVTLEDTLEDLIQEDDDLVEIFMSSKIKNNQPLL